MSGHPALPRRGLYALTPDDAIDTATLAGRVAAAIAGGAALIQYRDKGADYATRLARASALLGVCRTAGVPLIINDDVALAAALGAGGVHIGRDDLGLAAARATLGATRIIGVSCYDSLARAHAAAAGGADYVAFGSFFASTTKPHARPCPLGVLVRARAELTLPIVAIGGIRLDNAADLLTHGADLLAVVSAVFGSSDVRAAARAFADLF